MGSKRLIVQTSKFLWKGENRPVGYELTAEDLDGVGQNVINALVSGGKVKYDEDDAAPKHDEVLAGQIDALTQSLGEAHAKLDAQAAKIDALTAALDPAAIAKSVKSAVTAAMKKEGG